MILYRISLHLVGRLVDKHVNLYLKNLAKSHDLGTLSIIYMPMIKISCNSLTCFARELIFDILHVLNIVCGYRCISTKKSAQREPDSSKIGCTTNPVYNIEARMCKTFLKLNLIHSCVPYLASFE